MEHRINTKKFIHKSKQAHKDLMELLNRIKSGDMQLAKCFRDFSDLGEPLVVVSMIDDAPTIGTDHSIVSYKINDKLLVCLTAARARGFITVDT
jgi:hypothetical protein